MSIFLITGNLGYIGPVLEEAIKKDDPSAVIIGCDSGYFRSSFLENNYKSSRSYADVQYYLDVRNVNKIQDIVRLHRVDHIIHLAAISNDPMGKEFELVTNEINHLASINLAKIAFECDVSSFTFASSCSVYGAGGNTAKTELDDINPLTAYAKSKINTESSLVSLVDSSPKSTKVTCLRFATACGASPRIRLDLVLNDFVATALSTGNISILSDGTPYRPLIDVHDMASLLIWSTKRVHGDQFEIYNAGGNYSNYQVKDLAYRVQSTVNSEIDITINDNAPPDKRSYQVNFDKLYNHADPKYLPSKTLDDSISMMINFMKDKVSEVHPKNRENLIRLATLRAHIKSLQLDNQLFWNN